MYEPMYINAEKSIVEFLGEPQLFSKEDHYDFDYIEYITSYPYLEQDLTAKERELYSEALCISIVKFVKEHYCKDCWITNAPMTPLHVCDVLKSKAVGHMVNVDCAIRKVGEVKQEITKVGMICKKCGCDIPQFDVTNKTLLDGKIVLPPDVSCTGCDNRTGIVDPDRCEYKDTQYITAQELQENTTHGEQPKNIICVLRGSLVNKLKAGERVRLTGIVRIKLEKDTFASTFIDVYGINTNAVDATEVILTDADIEHIKMLSTDTDIFDKLANSLSPLIYGYDVVKKACLLCIFGGTTIDIPESGHIRGNSHVLLCGDPALAKSQLLRAISDLIPRSVYTSGKSSSAAGLTAAAVKDEMDGKWVLEAGALPLADGGIAVIDELDKMNENDRSSLHEAMEQQTISISKAGISAQLYTRCSILAAANPVRGKFDRNIPLSNQVDLPPSLMSRFDLVYLMLDTPNLEMDSRVANHILRTRQSAERLSSGTTMDAALKKPIDSDTFRKYLTYAKTVVPIISDAVIDTLQGEYVKMRAESTKLANEDCEVHIRITPRQLEALIRLSEASARIRLSTEVTIEDVQKAIALYRAANNSISLSTATMDNKLWRNKGDNIIVSLVPSEGITIGDLLNDVTKHTLMDIVQANEELNRLVEHHKLEVKRIGTATFVLKP